MNHLNKTKIYYKYKIIYVILYLSNEQQRHHFYANFMIKIMRSTRISFNKNIC